MKKTTSILLVSMIVISQISARPVKRIKFPVGATLVVVTGTLTGFKDSQTYLIRMRANQHLITEQNGKNNITVSITSPKGEPLGDMDLSCHSNHDVEAKSAGDYKIEVVECQKADPWKGTFRMIVKAED